MSHEKLSYDALRQRLEQAEAILAALRRGEVDLVIGAAEPLVVRFKSLVEENERLARQWRATLDAANDAIWLLDEEHRILQSNRMAERFFGKPCEELIGRRCWEIVHGTSAPIPECPVLRAKQSSDRASIELPIGDRWFEVTVDPIQDGEGSYTGAIHIVSDITERKQAEARIEHLDRVLRAIRAVNQLITHEQDRDALLRRACEILVSLRGYRSAWVVLRGENGAAQMVAGSGIGADCARLCEALERGDWPACCRQAWEQPDNVVPIHDVDRNCTSCSLSHIHRDTDALAGALRYGGRDYGVLVVDQPKGLVDDPEEQSLFRELAGDVAYALFSRELAREREETLEALRESEKHFRLVIENAPDAIIVQTRSCFAYLNPAAVRCFGAESADQLLGQPVLDRVEPRFRDLGAQRIRQLNEEKKGCPMLEMTYLKMDGSPFPVETSAVPINWQDQDGGLVFFRDITERKSLDAQLRQAQKMEAVGRLAGGVAHDFNNVLTVIHLSTQFLQRKLRPEDPLWQYVQRIQDASQRAASLTKQLLAFSRQEIVEPKILNLNRVVGDLGTMLQRLIGEDIDVRMLLAGDLWPVKIDATQVEQVIVNLAVNARDAMPAGGELTIETANVVLDPADAACHLAVEPGEYVLLAVNDTGIGMGDEVRAHIFEPFFTTKEKGKGTGLGLSTVYGIVKQNGGHIAVYSEEGQGTTFKIYLPRVAEGVCAPSDQSRECAAPTARGAETLLLVEDETEVRELMRDILAAQGYSVLTAQDGVEALRVAGEYDGPIHLLVTDVVMPRLNGRALADQLTTSHPKMQVLFTSGYTDNAIMRDGVLEKGVRFLPKPFEEEVLARKVRDVLDGRA